MFDPDSSNGERLSVCVCVGGGGSYVDLTFVCVGGGLLSQGCIFGKNSLAYFWHKNL